MPRIPQAELDRIKSSTDLAALVRSRGIDLKKHGNGHFIGTCPFHEDDEPSFVVTPAKGLFHCMGCGVAGNPIQFVEKFDGVSFRHAFELLNDGKAFTSGAGQPLKRSTTPKLEMPVKLDAEDTELMTQTIQYYHERLMSPSGKPAREYLKHRGLYNEAAIKHFKLGVADRTLGLRLPEKNRKAGKEIRTRLQKVGLIRKSGHEHFNGCLVMPVADPVTGNVVEVYGRKICNVSHGQPKHLYLPGPHAGIWNFPATSSRPSRSSVKTPASELILCEAPLDALTFYANGIKNVTFIYGTEGFPDYMLETFIKNRIKTVRLAYDADNAGNRAAERDTARLTAHGIEVYRLRFPHGMDVNSYATAAKPPQEALTKAISAAEWQDEATTGAPAPTPINNKSLAANLATKNFQPQADPPSAEATNQKTTSQTSRPLRSSVKNPPPQPTQKQPCNDLTRTGEYHAISYGQRDYRISGLDKNNSLDVLKISLRLRHGEDFHLDSIDMTRDNERRRYIERAAEETGLERDLIKRDIGRLLLALEESRQERVSTAATADTQTPAHEMTPAEHAEALEFLRSPALVKRITETFDACGLVGEESNRLAAYLACTSRKLDRPLAVIIQSTSAAGKSTLMEAVLAMFPEEERVQYSAMTGQSLYYLGETNLKHRILAIVEEEGAEKASYALKLLQSEGELTIASTGKDPHTGRMETQEYHVEGPVMIFLTTTAIEIDEELQNRCLTLTVDESREQTARIHTLQRQARTLEGLQLKKRKQRMLTLLRNVQRLLEPVDVVNPYADQLTFTAERTRTRRDHEKYLTLIDAIALLHQHQRPRQQLLNLYNPEPRTPNQEPPSYITVTLDDIKLANQLAPELLGRSLDELSPQTRRLLDHAKTIVRKLCETEETEQHLSFFSRRDLREHCGWTEFQVRTHMNKLESLEYVQRRIGSRGRRCVYELLADIEEPNNSWHIGLLDVDKLRTKKRKTTTTTKTSSIKKGTSGNFVKSKARSSKPIITGKNSTKPPTS